MMPRHEMIVEQIFKMEDARIFIMLIGVSEVGMFFWILSKWRSALCAGVQIFIVLLMNIIEFLLVPDLLMFGQLNLLIAFGFCIIIYLQEFKFSNE